MADNVASGSDELKVLKQWFPTLPSDRIDSSEWRLDVVTLLAVIGESSMAEHSQTITASAFCLLPRIIPAPQALLKPSRPLRMPQTPAKLTGVISGVVLDTVGFFANIIHPLDNLPPFAFKVLEISHKNQTDAAGDIVARRTPPVAHSSIAAFSRRVFGLWRRRKSRGPEEGEAPGKSRIPGPPSLDAEETLVGTGATGEGEGGVGSRARPGLGGRTRTVAFSGGLPDPEQGGQPQQPPPSHTGLRRRQTAKDKMTDFVSNPTLAQTGERPAIPAALYSPVHVLAVLSMLLTVGLLVAAQWMTDGPATIAVVTISVQSSLVGYASWWRPVLMRRSHTNEVPRGDVMIRTREGAFVYVQCTEDVARELYTAGTEECEYRVGGRLYRLLMGLGTTMLMLSAVLLGNCSWNMQLFVGAAYISLNGLYWAMGMLPRHMFWDLSRYEWKDVTPEDSKSAHVSLAKDDPNYDPREGVVSFTRTLWFAIRETGLTGWVERSGAAPMTPEWRKWLVEAEKAAREGNRSWPAVGRKDDLIRPASRSWEDGFLASGYGGGKGGPLRPVADDPGKQHAPLTEVQVPDGGRLQPDSF